MRNGSLRRYSLNKGQFLTQIILDFGWSLASESAQTVQQWCFSFNIFLQIRWPVEPKYSLVYTVGLHQVRILVYSYQKVSSAFKCRAHLERKERWAPGVNINPLMSRFMLAYESPLRYLRASGKRLWVIFFLISRLSFTGGDMRGFGCFYDESLPFFLASLWRFLYCLNLFNYHNHYSEMS